MEIILISGGLGNQMFQYAFYLAKTKNNPNAIITDSYYHIISPHNGYELERVFGLPATKSNFFYLTLYKIVNKIGYSVTKKGRRGVKYIFNLFNHGFVRIFYDEKIGIFDANLLKKRRVFCLYWGHWLSEKFFLSMKDEIRNTFTFKECLLSSKSKELYDIIKEENSISIHIRRGDYLSSSNINYVGNICNITYYIEAIKKIEQMVENPVFFIFSNDIKWAQENLQLANVHYIDWNKKEDSWQDMFLMSKCKHNIIANSTFSWWGAWLNQYVEKIIISPDLFYNGEKATDLIPESWIKIKTKQEGNLYN